MSLCPLSRRTLARYGRQFDKTFVHGSAHHAHSLILIEPNGDVWETDPARTTCFPSATETTTSARLKVEAIARSLGTRP